MPSRPPPPTPTPPTPTDVASTSVKSNRRDAVRAPIELKVEYRRLNSFFADYTRNISKGGTFIATARPLPIGTAFVFRLTVPTLAAPLELRGTVAWIVREDEATAAQPAGMGIRFQYDDDGERQFVHDTIEKLMVDSLGPVLYRKLLEETAENEGGGAGGLKSQS
jgi:type IV pilus assembly protein PilZ